MIKLLVLILLTSTCVASDQDIANMASSVKSVPRAKLTREDLPKGYESEVLEYLRKTKGYVYLLRLNDQQTIDAMVREFEAKEGKDRWLQRAFRESKSPYFIDEIAPLLYREDVMNPRRYTAAGDDPYSDLGFSHTVAFLIEWSVRTSPEFSEEVKHSELGSGEDSIARMRIWWEANRDALTEERYGDVGLLPGRIPEIVERYEAERIAYREAQAGAKEAEEEKATSSKAFEQDMASPIASTKEFDPDFVENTDSRKSLLPWILGALVGTGLALACIFKFRNKRQR